MAADLTVPIRPIARAPLRRQRGLVLLALVVFLGTAALYLFLGRLDTASVSNARNRRTESALSEAKEALIGRAAGDANRPGTLPCPDLVTNLPGNNIPGDGNADLFAGHACPSYIGWFPWRTLGLAEPRDGWDERLWYALSPSVRDDDSAEPINTTTSGDLKLDTSAQIAAIVFSAGPPLAGQGARPSLAVADYLEGANADGNGEYFSSPASAGFNDRALAVSRAELFARVAKRVLAELRGAGTPSGTGLLKYRLDNGVFPWADVGGDGVGDEWSTEGHLPNVVVTLPPWVERNGWIPLVTYRVDAPRTAMTVDIGGQSIACAAASCQ